MVGIVRNNESCVQISDAESPHNYIYMYVLLFQLVYIIEANTVTVALYSHMHLSLSVSRSHNCYRLVGLVMQLVVMVD